MSVLVDTNVIADVLYSDPVWSEWSKAQLALHVGQLLVNPFIYAELCYRADSPEQVDQVVAGLGLQYEDLPRSALYLASQAFRTYRGRGGIKTSPMPDFFIGAHAAARGIPVLTRDVVRYRSYFPGVTLISP